ncbi:hypothetical protein [Amorphus sp. 3PC139-8]|uniref:hypothetical protein n=1 Tax=Amorphus sp. 3PC139-8 TaxID=2735676 RepID=UPI00345D36D3
MPSRVKSIRVRAGAAVSATVLAAALLSACSSTPGAPLLGPKSDPPVPQATTGNATRPDGYPNPLVDPVEVPGTPLTAAEQADLQADLERQRDATQAQRNF